MTTTPTPTAPVIVETMQVLRIDILVIIMGEFILSKY